MVTRASHVEVTPGAALHDVVTVSGLPASYDATVRATLHGPFAERPGADDCTAATRAGRVKLAVTGDGTYTTPSITVADVGYYTWVETFPGDEATVPVTTPCGLVEETTRVVPFTPEVRTTTSRQRALVGASLRDTVEVSGVEGTALTVQWTLHGPRAPRDGSCREVSWSGAPVVATGSMRVPGDGRYRTPATTVRRAGCYTYEQHVAATPWSTEALLAAGAGERDDAGAPAYAAGHHGRLPAARAGR